MNQESEGDNVRDSESVVKSGVNLGSYNKDLENTLTSASMRGASIEIDCDEDCEHLYFGHD